MTKSASYRPELKMLPSSEFFTGLLHYGARTRITPTGRKNYYFTSTDHTLVEEVGLFYRKRVKPGPRLSKVVVSESQVAQAPRPLTKDYIRGALTNRLVVRPSDGCASINGKDVPQIYEMLTLIIPAALLPKPRKHSRIDTYRLTFGKRTVAVIEAILFGELS